MSASYKLNKKCKHCGNRISDTNKTGFCFKCYPKYGMFGENNPFYGKKHSKECINSMKEKCRIASTEKWKDLEYRNNVLSSVIGLKRSEEFKIAQSERTKKQMENIEQRKLRSKIMKESWENGNIVYTPHLSTNSSKQEKLFFEELNKFVNVKQKHVIKYINEITKRKRHLFPDGFIEDLNLIIEFHGSFWHADIRLFPDDNDIVHHNISAGDIRKGNEEKRQLYKKLGYNYIEIWSKDFLDDPNNTIKNILEKIELFK